MKYVKAVYTHLEEYVSIGRAHVLLPRSPRDGDRFSISCGGDLYNVVYIEKMRAWMHETEKRIMVDLDHQEEKEHWLSAQEDFEELEAEVELAKEELSNRAERIRGLRIGLYEWKLKAERYGKALRYITGRLIKEDRTRPKPANAVFYPLVQVCPVCECIDCAPNCAKAEAEAESEEP